VLGGGDVRASLSGGSQLALRGLLRARHRGDLTVDAAAGRLTATQGAAERQRRVRLQPIERRQRIARGGVAGAIDVGPRFDALADDDADDEHRADDHRPGEEQREDLAAVQADFDLVSVELVFASHGFLVG
jgi:hypothetical protein